MGPTSSRNLILDHQDQTNQHMDNHPHQSFLLMRLKQSQLLCSLVNTILLEIQLMLLLSSLLSKMESSSRNMITWIISVSWLVKKPLTLMIFLLKSKKLHKLHQLKRNYQWTTHSPRTPPSIYIEIDIFDNLMNQIIYFV